MSIFDLTAATAALKELYAGQVVQNTVYKDNPTLAFLPKMTEFGGKSYPVPIQIGVSQGRSSVFATAQSNQTAAKLKEFFVTRARDYSVAQIDNETMLSSATDKMSFVRGAKTVVDSAIRAIKLSLASAIFRSGTGSIGGVGSISTGVITLSNTGDVVQFEVDMTLQAASSDGGAPRAAVGYVVAVDRTAGTVTVSASGLGGAAGTPTGWTAGDFLLVQGDSNAKIKGFAAWLPSTAPTSGDNFFGVDRSIDPVRLAGVRYDGTAQSIEEALIDASMLVGREGGSPEKCVMSYASFAALEKALGSKVQYVDAKGPADISFRGIVVNGANTRIEVFPDRNCQSKTAYLLQMDTWELASLGECPQILRYADGNEMLRVTNSDAAELRVGYYGNLVCNAPGWNANIALGA